MSFWYRLKKALAASLTSAPGGPVAARFVADDVPPLTPESHPVVLSAVEMVAAFIAQRRLVVPDDAPEKWAAAVDVWQLVPAVALAVKDALLYGDGWLGATPDRETVRWLPTQKVSPRWAIDGRRLESLAVGEIDLPASHVYQLRFDPSERRGTGLAQRLRPLVWMYDQLMTAAVNGAAAISRLPVFLEAGGMAGDLPESNVVPLPRGATLVALPQGWTAKAVQPPEVQALIAQLRLDLALSVGLPPSTIEPTSAGSFSAGRVQWFAASARISQMQEAVIRDILEPLAEPVAEVRFRPVGLPDIDIKRAETSKNRFLDSSSDAVPE